MARPNTNKATPGSGLQIPNIPYDKFTLDNGLTVIVHEDHKAPIVSVNVWYHVGSKNEPEGKSGFAHLFEHLMFNGSEHFNDDYFKLMELVGATELNGTTSRDRTNYFQNVPTSALRLALWMESDRMGHLLGAIDQDKLDEQRRVVKNEKREGENQPYGRVHERLTEATYPKGHPYDHTVIGSMEDLDAASVLDVHDWFKAYYGPNNAVLVIAGDVASGEAHSLAAEYFGDIPPGPPVGQFRSWIAPLSGDSREVMQDRVPQARILKAWNVPPTYDTDYYRLSLASSILSSGMSSRFYKRLVYKDRIATEATAYVASGEIGSQFMVEGTAHPGQDLGRIESALDEELERFLAEGPTEEEFSRVATKARANFVRRIERIGGFSGKSAILARGQVYRDSPAAYRDAFRVLENTSLEDVRRVAEKWLRTGSYTLEILPFAPWQASGTSRVERNTVPTAPEPVDAVFPAIERASLPCDIPVLLARRSATPLVHVTMLFDAGFAADQFGIPGTANMAMNLLNQGTAELSALEINNCVADLGAHLGGHCNLDGSTVSLSALKENLEPSLDLFAEVIRRPAFPQAEFDRVKQEQFAAIQAEKASPVSMALRVFPGLLYGPGHAYSLPLTGSGTEESLVKMERSDIASHHETWMRPNAAAVVVAGDTTLDEITPLLSARFQDWEGSTLPAKNIAAVAHRETPAVYLVDRPGSLQSIVFAGHVAPPRRAPNNLAIRALNRMLGGSFTSRINMNLREDKGWCYGAQSVLLTARGQRPFVVVAAVQSDKTRESMEEILGELRGIAGDMPPTEDEVMRAKESMTRTLAGRWETSAAIESSLLTMVQHELPEDYFHTYAQQVRGLDVDQVTEAAREVIQPDRLVWVVVGDRATIEPSLQGFTSGAIRMIDADGNLLDES